MDMKEMREIEKQAHLIERLEKTYDGFILENNVSRISVLGAIKALELKVITSWQAQDVIPDDSGEEEDDQGYDDS